MGAQLKVLPTNVEDKDAMLRMLDAVRSRVEADGIKAIVVLEIPVDVGSSIKLHDFGDAHYSEFIGWLEMAKVRLAMEAVES